MIDFDYKVIRTKRKSFAISVTPDGTVTIRCPKEATDKQIRKVMEHHAENISKSLARLPKLPDRGTLTSDDVARLKLEAKQYLPSRVEHFGAIMGVRPDRIKITSGQKSWASCIRKGIKNQAEGRHYTICFSYRVMQLPKELRDMIVIHELAHMTEMNHSPAFYAILAKYEPSHRALTQQINQYQSLIPLYVKDEAKNKTKKQNQ